jgi:DNA-binding NtrC family response regulator
MYDPILVISYTTELNSRIERLFQRAGITVEMMHGGDPGPARPIRGIVVVPAEHTDLDMIHSTLQRWDAPLFLISSVESSMDNTWLHIHADTLATHLIPEVRRHTAPLSTTSDTIWVSPSMRAIRTIINRIGPTQLPVLITGESGTGKEVIARALHSASERKNKRLVVVDCAAISPTLMESELFGHLKGAFTGATTTTRGLAREADNSTFFLDEIGELPTPVQVKLLRLLQDGSFRSVGGTTVETANLRIIAATNRDIEAEVAAGNFRRDLYHRLNGARIHIPPLRERPSDIQPLFERYLVHYCQEATRPILSLSDEVTEILSHAHWPGNVRELVNCAHFVASLSAGTQVQVDDLPPSLRLRGNVPKPGFLPPIHSATPISAIRTDLTYKDAKRKWLEIFEAQYIQAILTRNQGNVSAAAQDAQMDRRSIQRMVKRLGTTPEGEESDE